MKTAYENSLFYQIHSTAKFFDKLFEQFFEEIDMGVTCIEHLSLNIIKDVKDCCQRDLAKIILKDRANTGKLATTLKDKGLITINLTTKNNRPVKILTITQKGENLLKETNKLFLPLRQDIEKVFAKDTLKNMKKNLQKFRKTVEKSLKTTI